MAKREGFQRDPTAATAKATADLKKELQRLVKAIVEESSPDEQTGTGFTDRIEKATRNLQALRDLKEGRKQRSSSYPQEFLCPISKELMKDPVIISTGNFLNCTCEFSGGSTAAPTVTFDRASIQKWLKSGNRTCPKTEEVLAHTIVIPNLLIREIISQWCKNHSVEFPTSFDYSDEHESTQPDRDLLQSLLNKMSSTLSDQKEAARLLRSITKKTPSFRALFGEKIESIPQLLSPLCQSKSETEIDADLQEDLITTLLNISIHDNNKKPVAEIPIVIPILLDALKSGKIETRSNAAAALFTLSAPDSNKELIGKSGGLKPLIDLLDNGHELAIKDAASAIFNLCLLHENKGRAVLARAVSVLLTKIEDRVHVDELLPILAMLSTNHRAIEELSEIGAVSCLFSLIKETNSGRNKENCVSILYSICFSDRSKWKEMWEEEEKYGTISEIAENGTSRGKRKATGILDRLNRGVSRTHTA